MTTIADATDIVAVVSTDKIPVQRAASTTAYCATILEILDFVRAIPLDTNDDAILSLATTVTGLPWRFHSFDTAFSGVKDHVLNIGMNSNNSPTGHTDLTRAGMSWQMELDYYYVTGTDSEIIFAWEDPTNTIARRPWQINMTHATGDVYIQLKGHLSVYDSAGVTTLLDIPDNGDEILIPALNMVFGGYCAPVVYDLGTGQPRKITITNGVVGSAAYTYP